MYVIIRSLYLYLGGVAQVLMLVILMAAVLAKPMNNDQEATREIGARGIRSIVIFLLFSRILMRNNYNTVILLFFTCGWIKRAQNYNSSARDKYRNIDKIPG